MDELECLDKHAEYANWKSNKTIKFYKRFRNGLKIYPLMPSQMLTKLTAQQAHLLYRVFYPWFCKYLWNDDIFILTEVLRFIYGLGFMGDHELTNFLLGAVLA